MLGTNTGWGQQGDAGAPGLLWGGPCGGPRQELRCPLACLNSGKALSLSHRPLRPGSSPHRCRIKALVGGFLSMLQAQGLASKGKQLNR